MTPRRSADFARASRLLYLRHYAAKLNYELELHGGERSLDEMPARYSQLLGAGDGVPWAGETFLSDVDPGFYCAGICGRGRWRPSCGPHLRERFGETWFAVAEAGRCCGRPGATACGSAPRRCCRS